MQPIIAKQILPWFGGSAAVWTTCLVFFQSVLTGGYAYGQLSHLMSLVVWLTGAVPAAVSAQATPGPAGSDVYDAFAVRCRSGALLSISGAAAYISRRHHRAGLSWQNRRHQPERQ